MKILSVIIPVYNQQDLIIKAINSIPVRDDVEIIVIDDASTDKTLARVKELATKRDITIIQSSIRKPIGFCRNLGLEAATGKFIFWLDSDDYVITDLFTEFIDFVYSHSWSDVIHIDIIDNRGVYTKGVTACGTPTKVTKLATINKYNLRFEEITVGEDLIFWNDLKVKKIIATWYKKVFYHYNYPREGSTTWLANHGKIRKDCNFIKR